MFEDYKIAVLNFYREQHGKGLLSTEFENPNRERLRKECVAVFLRKNSIKDQHFVQAFFDPQKKYSDQVRSIEKFKLDKFRPLVGFLTTDKDIRDDNHVKLLAWLLNFPEYADWRNEVLGDGEGNDNGETSQGDDGNSEIVEGNDNGENSQGKDEVTKPLVPVLFKVACCFIIVFVASTTYLLWRDYADKDIRKPLPTEKYMYWTGLHYEPTAGNDKTNGKLIIPLNKEQLANQQRITSPDTLTNYSLGKIWYGKTNWKEDGKPQFYTDSGTNPLDTTKRLLPLTAHILNKYISYQSPWLNTLVWTASLLVLFSLLITLAYKTRPKGDSFKYYLQRFK